jgi:DNA-binding IclR family transcriptional regulator
MVPARASRPTAPGTRYEIAAVTNALSILYELAEHQPVSLSDATRAAGVSKSTAFRLLATLQAAGAVEQLPHGGYQPGQAAIRWALSIIDSLDIRMAARPLMTELRSETGETVNLAAVRGSSLLYVEVLESPSAFRMAEGPGTIAPVHATALGRAIAPHLDPAQLELMLGPEPFEAFTERTPRTAREFRATIADQSIGYAVDLEEVAIGVVCVAAPILAGGTAIGALSVSMPRARCDDARLQWAGRRTAAVAAEISNRISHG